MSTWQSDLLSRLHGRVCVLGVGNESRGDDGAGSLLARLLEGRLTAPCVNGGMAPENVLEKIAATDPETVLIIDATDFGGIPGEIRVFPAESIDWYSFSTHAVSLALTSAYFHLRNNAAVILLAIQPAACELDSVMSPEVSEAVSEIEEAMLDSPLALSKYDTNQYGNSRDGSGESELARKACPQTEKGD